MVEARYFDDFEVTSDGIGIVRFNGPEKVVKDDDLVWS